MDERITPYLQDLCSQIRFRQAHERVRREYACHILDQRDALMARGMGEEEATALSLSRTGDAGELGAELDRVHRPRPQWRLLLLCLAILLLGQVLRRGIGADFSIQPSALLVGMALLSVCYLMDLDFLREVGVVGYGLGLALYGVLLLQRQVGMAAYIWIMGTFDALWVVGMLFPLLYAGLLYGLRGRSYRGMVLAQLIYTATLLLLALTPSLPGLLVFGFCGLGLLFFAHVRRWFGLAGWRGAAALFGPVAAVLCAFFALALYFQAANPPYFTDPGLVPHAVRELLKSSMFAGGGAALSEAGSFLLEFLGRDPSLFVDLQLGLAHLAYRFGWLVFGLVVLPMLGLLALGVHQWRRLGNDLARFVSLGVLLTFGLQVGIYLLNNLGILLVEGMPLPLMTGGTIGFVLHMGLLGCMLACFRSGGAWAEGPPRWKQARERAVSPEKQKEENCEKS